MNSDAKTESIRIHELMQNYGDEHSAETLLAIRAAIEWAYRDAIKLITAEFCEEPPATDEDEMCDQVVRNCIRLIEERLK